jgi:hypothetical protein
MEIESKDYFAADEGTTTFKKALEMDQAGFHIPFLLPAFLYHSF